MSVKMITFLALFSSIQDYSAELRMLDTKWYYQGFSQPNSMIITVCFLVAATVIASLVLYLSRYLVKEKTIPGLILTTAEDGNIGEIKAAGSFQNFLQNLHNLLGPIASFWYGGLYTVSIASPELFKEHAHAFDRPCK
ncbi:hypothetical protein RRG08_061773 [Elysia crispata]|uniref:Uncharacterized protein n=1 Tax=Elysia crispata TaxID=231223 RepID=A0AAE1A768_9GAST|nr:hypothetical protein RRG08_061773 [Elysia crispata]